jgi:hypothetical protein
MFPAEPPFGLKVVVGREIKEREEGTEVTEGAQGKGFEVSSGYVCLYARGTARTLFPLSAVPSVIPNREPLDPSDMPPTYLEKGLENSTKLCWTNTIPGCSTAMASSILGAQFVSFLQS